MDNCIVCGKDHKGYGGLYMHHKFICVDCQREIAKAYAGVHLDPAELLMLKHANGDTTIEIKVAKR